MARSFVSHLTSRLSFTTYGVNSRGEVIPIKTFGAGDEVNKARTEHAVKRALQEAGLKIRPLKYL